MPSLLSMGAGAGQGLDEYLQRLFVEQQARIRAAEIGRAQTETERKNKAEEEYRNKVLSQGNALRTQEAADKIENASAIGDVMSPTSAGFLKAAGREGQLNAQAPQASPPGISAPLDIVPGQVPGQTTYLGNAGQRKTAADDAELKRMGEDPSTDPTLRSFIKMRAVLPKGENIPWQLLEPNAGKTPKSLQHVPATIDGVKGKVMAEHNPADGTWTFQGQPIDAGRVHPLEPPASFTPVQTGDAYGSFNRRTGGEAPMQGPGGAPVPLATTSSTRTMGEGAKMLQPHIADLKAQAAELDKAGLFGPVMSRVRHAAESAGTLDEFYGNLESDPNLQNDPKVGKFATSLGLMATGAGRVHGGARGGSSPQMYQHFKQMLSDAGTVQMFNGRLDAVDSYMSGYAAGPGSTAPTATDPYQEYLNRQKK